MNLRQITLSTLLALAMALPAQAQEVSAEHRASIEQLMRITGTANLTKQMAATMSEQMMQALRKSRPDIPKEIVQVLPEEVMGVFDENMGSFMDELVPLYAKYFSNAEIQEVIAFYSTDLGKKMIASMPSLMHESMLAGARWGQALGPTIEKRVKARLKREGAAV